MSGKAEALPASVIPVANQRSADSREVRSRTFFRLWPYCGAPDDVLRPCPTRMDDLSGVERDLAAGAGRDHVPMSVPARCIQA